ncbi:MAG: hypothetical protein RL156_1129, partial [Bacteroidota bacterium]
EDLRLQAPYYPHKQRKERKPPALYKRVSMSSEQKYCSWEFLRLLYGLNFFRLIVRIGKSRVFHDLDVITPPRSRPVAIFAVHTNGQSAKAHHTAHG